ncbi:MAG: transcriptional regulator [Pseudonocardiales bacterium]|nr:PadR family transcriptional regulator [Actinomycetota bacterium]PZS24394.1 MAG: transcriptional regulator [Pseudonocardiales bacterium]
MYPDHHHSHRHGHRSTDGGPPGQRRHHPDARPDGPGGHRTRGGRPQGAGRGRAQRGDVRTALLLLLAEEPMHGYQLMQAITERTSGAWRPSPGAVYPTLSQLEDEGLIDTVAGGGRKLATLTDAGQAYLHSHGETMPDPFAEFTARCGGGSDLRGALEELRYPTRQLALGDAAQVQAARQVLADARRSLYLILAGSPTPGNEASDQ